MAKNFLGHGRVVAVVLTAAATSGSIVKIGNIIGVATTDGAIGDTINIELAGNFTLPKVAATVIAMGAPLYYDPTAKVLTPTTATGLFLVGVAIVAALSADTTVKAHLDGTIRLAA
jgi:predicted RecA/RadA family phage recombinase